MSHQIPAWIQNAGKRMDPALKRQLVRLYSGRRNITATLMRPLQAAWRERFYRMPILIQLKDDHAGQDTDQLCTWLQKTGCRRVMRLKLINSIAVNAPLPIIKSLVNHPKVKRLSLDRTVHTLLDATAAAASVPPVWRQGNLGTGIGIAVIDTGIHPHPDFGKPQNRLVAFYDAVHHRAQPYDDNGHGTHVAGIAAGSGDESDGRFRGMAPGAWLIGVKVLDGQGVGTLSQVISGLEWICHNHRRYNIKVLNCSLGTPAAESYRDDPLAQAVQKVLQLGIVVCAAAGNDGPYPGTIATPGIHPGVITVGACTRSLLPGPDGDVVADFSSRGPTIDGLSKPDLVAPGVEITSCNAPGSTIARRQRNNSPYITLSGTSMATPVVAGIAALLLHARPSAKPEQIKWRLRQTATSIAGSPLAAGSGAVNAWAAINQYVQLKSPTG